MIKTIIFDIGGVLIGYDWTKHLLKEFNNNEILVEKIKANVFSDHKWDEVDRGVLSEAELLESFTKNAPELTNEITHFWNTAGDALWQYDFTKDWLIDLKNKGYQLLFLSNWSSHLRTQATKQLDFLPLMDGGIFSYEVKLIKPDHAIYQEIINKYDLIPPECVFLDDRLDNCEAAIECGLNAIWVENKDHAKALDGLAKLL